ncbi:MAG: hypothetical protein GY929_07260 [Actinomycetia bacterium]|nr:hypothetical protein [Actinomycetes bacterium]
MRGSRYRLPAGQLAACVLFMLVVAACTDAGSGGEAEGSTAGATPTPTSRSVPEDSVGLVTTLDGSQLLWGELLDAPLIVWFWSPF